MRSPPVYYYPTILLTGCYQGVYFLHIIQPACHFWECFLGKHTLGKAVPLDHLPEVIYSYPSMLTPSQTQCVLNSGEHKNALKLHNGTHGKEELPPIKYGLC